jgi:hypothetical protein
MTFITYLLYFLVFSLSCAFLIFAISTFNKPKIYFEDYKKLSVYLMGKLSDHFILGKDIIGKDKEYVDLFSKHHLANLSALSQFAINVSESSIEQFSNYISEEDLQEIVQKFLQTVCPIMALCMHTGMSFEEALEEYHSQVMAS